MRSAGYWAVMVIGVALIAAPSLAVAQEHSGHSGHVDASSVQGKIMTLEKQWFDAYKTGDTKALDAILDESAVLTYGDGSVRSKRQFLEGLRAPNSQEPLISPESVQVHAYGEVAIASGVRRVKGVQRGAVFVRRESFTDTWLHKGESWVCVATSATPITY